ncbi:sugar O-acyltransferase [Acinetobacter baumannii]
MKKLAIFGSGGFAKELVDLAYDQGYQEYIFLRNDMLSKNGVLGFPIQNESSIPELCKSGYKFAIAVGSGVIREKIFEAYPDLPYPNLIHSIITYGYGIQEEFANIKGLIIAAGARITNSCRFGHFIIVSFNSTIGHDCILENFLSVMPGVNVSGNVHLASKTYIGTDATILPGKSQSN